MVEQPAAVVALSVAERRTGPAAVPAAPAVAAAAVVVATSVLVPATVAVVVSSGPVLVSATAVVAGLEAPVAVVATPPFPDRTGLVRRPVSDLVSVVDSAVRRLVSVAASVGVAPAAAVPVARLIARIAAGLVLADSEAAGADTVADCQSKRLYLGRSAPPY